MANRQDMAVLQHTAKLREMVKWMSLRTSEEALR